MAPISVGDSLPNGQLGWFDENDQLQQVSIHSLAAGKKVILFGVPGAFTPTCRSGPHLLPSYFLGDPLDSCESACGSVSGSGSRGFDPVPLYLGRKRLSDFSSPCFDEGEDVAAMAPLPGMRL
jgi:hypothetical protein